VTAARHVVLRLEDRAERRKTAVGADRGQFVAPARQDLVRVSLVPDVPDDLVARRVEHRVERDRQLAGAEVGGEVPSDLSDGLDDVLADLLSQLLQLVVAQLVEVFGQSDSIEQVRHRARPYLLRTAWRRV
jgi:hypothetical protein